MGQNTTSSHPQEDDEAIYLLLLPCRLRFGNKLLLLLRTIHRVTACFLEQIPFVHFVLCYSDRNILPLF